MFLLVLLRRLRDGYCNGVRRAECWSADPDQDIDATQSPHCPLSLLRVIKIDGEQRILPSTPHRTESPLCPDYRVTWVTPERPHNVLALDAVLMASVSLSVLCRVAASQVACQF